MPTNSVFRPHAAPPLSARLTRLPTRSVTRHSTGSRLTPGSFQLDGGASYLSWQRTSGSPAMLPRTHSVPSSALSLSVTHVVVAPGTSYGDDHLAPYSPGPASAGARLMASSSPRALGDVPLLLSEQARLMAITPPATAPAPHAQREPRLSGSERRTRNASAAVAALAASEAALAAATAEQHARLPRNTSSFGADSKYGFDESSYSVFSPVSVESDMEFD